MDLILPRVGITFTSSMSRVSGVVLPDDPIKILGLEPTQELGLAVSVDPDNPLDVLLVLTPAHYMERRSRGSNDDDRGSLSMHVHFSENSGGGLGANIMRGHDKVFGV